MSKKTILDIKECKNKKKLTMITAYDATSAKIAEKAGIDMILVGDSLGMTMQGMNDTNSVTLDDMIYHTKIVAKNAPNTFIVADMPFMSYEISVEKALENAGRIFRETGARAVKMEGGKNILPQIKALADAGIPVMGHLGLTPQRAAMLGGFKAQARTAQGAQELLEDALLLENAGCFAVVLEAVPYKVADVITKKLSVPTISCGGGKYCDGQVLVFHDMLGFSDFRPRFVKKYADLGDLAVSAVQTYIKEVEESAFPAEEHCFNINDEEWNAFSKNNLPDSLFPSK